MFYQEVREGKGWFVMKMRRRARGMVCQEVREGKRWFVMKMRRKRDGF